jgi:hypothetical protein
MVLLASSYDQSKFFKAEDLEGDRKLRIKSVTEEAIGVGAEKENKLVVWFTNDKRGLALNRVNNRRCGRWLGRKDHHYLPDDGGDARQDGTGVAGANSAAQAQRAACCCEA